MDAEQRARALIETFDGVLDQPLVVAAAVVDGDDVCVRISPEEHAGSLFEFGSLGKTLTATLLAALVAEGVVGLDDTVSRWLDAGPNGEITLGQLATHTSGLPRLAPNHADRRSDAQDPYAAYSDHDAEAGLRAATRADVGTRAYSNFGFQLLGLALCRAAGSDFGSLLRDKVCVPLGMASTRVTSPGGPKVQGYRGGRSVSGWHTQLPGAGGLEATAADLAAYLQAVVDPPAGAAGDAMRFAMEHGLGWVTAPDGALWHNGGTGGFHSMLLADRERRRGAVAVVNSADLREIDAAVAMAARGQDPRRARPTPIGDDFDEIALVVASHLAANEWESLRALMEPSTAEALTEERLGGAWAQVMGPRGAIAETKVVERSRVGGAVRVTIDVSAGAGTGTITTYFDEHRRLVGLQIA